MNGVISLCFACIGAGCFMYGVIRSTFYLKVRENRKRIESFWYAMTWGMFLLSSIFTHSFLVYIDAPVFVYHLYNWWNNGGGGGLKTRLKSLKAKFITNKH